jgi:hypothetical protein
MPVASFPGPSKTITIEPIRLPAEDAPEPEELPVEPPEPEPAREQPAREPEKAPAK